MTNSTNHERIDTRLERHLKEVSDEVKSVHHEIIKLQSLYTAYDVQSKKNAEDIEKLKIDSYLAKGGLNLLKIIGTLCAGAIIMFFTWVVQSNHANEQRFIELNQKYNALEQDLRELK